MTKANMQGPMKAIGAQSVRRLVRLRANRREGWRAEDAVILAVQAGDVLLVQVVDPDARDADDGLREITVDQVDPDGAPSCLTCRREMVAARERFTDGTWAPRCWPCASAQ